MGCESLDCIALRYVTDRWWSRVNKAVTSGSVSWSMSASEDEQCHTELLVADIALSLVIAGCELIAPFPHSLHIPSINARTMPLFPTPFTFTPLLRAPYMYIKTRLRTLCVSLCAQEHNLCSQHSRALILYRCARRVGANIHMFCLSLGHVEARGEFRPRQTRQLPRAVDLKRRLLSCQKLLITTTPFHSLTERYSVNVDGNFN